MNEDLTSTFAEVAGWLNEPWAAVATTETPDEFWWKFLIPKWVAGDYTRVFLMDGIDPFIPAFKNFFQRVHEWVVDRWDQLWSWIRGLGNYIESLWNVLSHSLADLYHWIGDKIEGIVTMIGNWASILWEWLASDIFQIVDQILAPIRDMWDLLTGTLAEWFEKIEAVLGGLLGEPMQWALDLGASLWESIQALAGEIWQALIETANAVASWIGEKVSAHAPQLVEYLRDCLLWFWDIIKTAFVFVKDDIIPAVADATTGAIGWLKDQFTHLMGLAYDELIETAKSYMPITPERSLKLAGIMFGSAVGFGALAHGIALGVEAIPNLKYMGVHYLSSFAAHMGGFGLIASATMGVIAAHAIRVPFTYYVNNLLRPTIPDDRLLIEFRAKRELNFEQFKRYMGYHGHSDEWIAKIDSWLWKDPRLFEILYCADVTVPPREWLVRKFERAGYEDIDVDVLCRVVERRTTRSPRTYYTTSLRRNYRHGFIPREGVTEGVEALEMAPDAIDWIERSGELDNIYEINSDLVTAYRTAYKNDLITEAECKASLASLGLPSPRIEAIIYLEWVRKAPSAIKAERKEIADEWAEIQSSYSKAYIEAFRNGWISQDQLAAHLVAIGYKEKVAEGVAMLEAVKVAAKGKPEEIPTPIIPLPPPPPEYEA